MGQSWLVWLRMFFGMALFFGVYHSYSGGPTGPYTRAFDLTLMVGGGVGSLVMWGLGVGKFDTAGGGRLRCPECGTAPPVVRRPANRRQMLRGGWTCAQCGCELDRAGRKVTG